MPINIGWGSKQTQFHGSAGKAAALAPESPSSSQTATTAGASPNDDDDDDYAKPRISWRGDGAFFAVSSLSPPPLPSRTPRRRTIRTYDRHGALQSTSAPLPGLEHTLAWRPSGGVVACSQRFGSGGEGREGRHDVVFLERNGLRRGEFGLRVGEEGKRGYKVKELSWSSDSNVLAVWIWRDEGDSGE